MDIGLLFAAAAIGVVVGLTGMGGGALMTPTLVFFFGVPPVTAVSSDVVASAFMKPAGSWVHIRNKTVNWQLVRLLVYGSVPAAFLGVVAARYLIDPAALESFVKHALGVVLVIAALGLAVRAYLRLRERAMVRDGRAAPLPFERPEIVARPVPTVLVGVAGGLMVGLTSVGSGSLIIIALMALYPALKANQLVGTDLVQAVPLVVAAAIAHLIFGEVDWSVTLPVIIGSIPGTYLGAQLSSRIAGGLVRRALVFVLTLSGLKMMGLSNTIAFTVVALEIVVGSVAWALIRRRLGFPLFTYQERKASEASAAGSDASATDTDAPVARSLTERD